MKCHQASDKLLCEECSRKLLHDNSSSSRPWYIPPTERGRRRLERIRKKLQSISFFDIKLPNTHIEEQQAGNEWASRVEKFQKKEDKRTREIEDCDLHSVELVLRWRGWLAQQDGERRYKKWVKSLNETRGRPRTHDDEIISSDNRYDRHIISTPVQVLENYIDPRDDAFYDDKTEDLTDINNWSKDVFFQYVLLNLSVDEIHLLMIHVHRLRVIRDLGNERCCTTKDAAELYSRLANEWVSRATYCKRVERMLKKLGHDPEIWVKYYLL